MPTRKAPRIYRILIGAKNLRTSRRFYEKLLGVRGRSVAQGRVYFDCGRVIFGVLDFSKTSPKEWSPPAEAIYFATSDIVAIHRRAHRLDCLDPGLLHGDASSPLGEVVIRPWGERSFYVLDPSGNSLCFVDTRTLFTGTSRQVAAMQRASTR